MSDLKYFFTVKSKPCQFICSRPLNSSAKSSMPTWTNPESRLSFLKLLSGAVFSLNTLTAPSESAGAEFLPIKSSVSLHDLHHLSETVKYALPDRFALSRSAISKNPRPFFPMRKLDYPRPQVNIQLNCIMWFYFGHFCPCFSSRATARWLANL